MVSELQMTENVCNACLNILIINHSLTNVRARSATKYCVLSVLSRTAGIFSRKILSKPTHQINFVQCNKHPPNICDNYMPQNIIESVTIIYGGLFRIIRIRSCCINNSIRLFVITEFFRCSPNISGLCIFPITNNNTNI